MIVCNLFELTPPLLEVLVVLVVDVMDVEVSSSCVAKFNGQNGISKYCPSHDNHIYTLYNVDNQVGWI